MKLGQLVHDENGFEAVLGGNLVAEAETVIENPDSEVKSPARLVPERQQHLVVVVQYQAAFPPGLLPVLAGAAQRSFKDIETSVKTGLVTESQAQGRV